MQTPDNPKRMTKAIVWWCLAAGWIAVLFYLSFQPAVDSAQLSGSLAEKILRRLPFLDVNVATFESFLRKLAHFGTFAVEGFLIRLALYYTRPMSRGVLPLFRAGSWAALLACVPLAVANELSELLAPGRGCSVRDMGIDLAGALAGILVAALLLWIGESLRIRAAYAKLTGGGS